MSQIYLLKDKIDAIIKHHLNGAEREDLTDEQLKWLEVSIGSAVNEIADMLAVKAKYPK